jgi:hypothetical protein
LKYIVIVTRDGKPAIGIGVPWRCCALCVDAIRRVLIKHRLAGCIDARQGQIVSPEPRICERVAFPSGLVEEDAGNEPVHGSLRFVKALTRKAASTPVNARLMASPT